MMRPGLTEIFATDTPEKFNKTALAVFRYQAENNLIYKEFIEHLGADPERINTIEEIPFLPVSFFRTQRVVTGKGEASVVFESSGTTGSASGKHYVTEPDLYRHSFLRAFTHFYGDPSGYMIAGLLPSYLEKGNSSLVYMVNELISFSAWPGSGFYRNNTREMLDAIKVALSSRKKVLLLGVSYALLDLAESISPDLSGVVVMETGGMKGRRKEITREELHGILTEKFRIDSIHSEYGMTELLSQAYSQGAGRFHSPAWMKVVIRDPLDPLGIVHETGVTGGINIIDLANVNSCSFISTDDLGKVYDDGSFEVLGRIDNSDIRGCNLLIT